MDLSQILIVMVVAIGLTIFAERRGMQPPLLLAAVGLAASFIPTLPRTHIDPGILLSVVLPPLLYSAALDFSFFSFMRRLRSILNLGVLLVIITALAAGLVAGWALPALSLPAAMILGAAVAPPDAVSAAAVGGRLGLPNRLMTIIKGESLINDAAALTLFSVAVAAATGTRNFIDNAWLYFLYASFVGVAVGIATGLLVHQIRRRLRNPTLVTALAILVPFAAYGIADEIAASGVLAVVSAGFVLGHNAAGLGFAGRIQERQVWGAVDALLEIFVFAYIGLQLRFILIDADRSGFRVADLLVAAGLVLLTVMLVRIAWILATGVLGRWRYRQWIARGRPSQRGRALAEPLSWPENIVLSWAGMRGVVTIAAAVGTPFVAGDASAFTARQAIIPVAFAVAIGTLLLQGLTLPLLIRFLKVNEVANPETRRQQLVLARQAIRDASVIEINRLRQQASPEESEFVERFLARAQRADPAADSSSDGKLRRAQLQRALHAAKDVLTAQRRALITQRDAGRLDDEIMREVLENIDLEEAVLASRIDRA